MDAVRLADLRNPVFGEYRGVIAPRARLHAENVDSWLEKHGDPDLTSGVLSHVHMYDVIESVDDEVTLARLAQQVAQRWRGALAERFPDRQIVVGVDGEPDEYGPTIWMRTSKASALGVGFWSGQRPTVVPDDRRNTLRHWLRSKLPSQVVGRSSSERQTRSPE